MEAQDIVDQAIGRLGEGFGNSQALAEMNKTLGHRTRGIGTERFNYDLQRQEILLASGWTAVVPPELTGEGAIGPQARTVIGIDPERGDRPGFCRPLPGLTTAVHEILVTWEMIDAAVTFSESIGVGPDGLIPMDDVEYYPKLYRVMDALARPNGYEQGLWNRIKELEDRMDRDHAATIAKLTGERDAARAAITSLGGRICELESYSQTMAVENDRLRSLDLDQLRNENTELRKRLWLPVETGEHDYNGPVKPDPDTGRPVPVPDPVHERFHGSIGDVLAGRVIPAARRQMQEALKSAPKEPTTIPTIVQR